MASSIFQILTFITVSIIFGVLFKKFDLNVFLGIAFGASVQFIISYIFNSALNSIVALKNKQLENERIREFSMQGLEVECPCSKKVKAFVPIRLNTANKYKCAECQKTISVFVNSSTALATEPIEDTDTLNPKIIKDAIT
jgi:hypothetical protein